MRKILLIALVLICSTHKAYADACATKLMPAFTAAQATSLCKNLGTSINHSLIPSADNTYDLGDATHDFRSLYLQTSLLTGSTTLPFVMSHDAQRLITLGGASDTSLSLTWGDAGVTATQNLSILASTADADDDSILNLGGGGAASGIRGAYLTLEGNETGGGGRAILGSGASTLSFDTDTSTRWRIDTAGNLNSVTTNGGDLNLSATGRTVAIQEATAGSACSGGLTANGATPVVTSTTCATTGSRIFLSRTSAETGVVEAWISALTNATSFAITGEAGDTGTYNWVIFHEAS